jgi:hypothetical protein
MGNAPPDEESLLEVDFASLARDVLRLMVDEVSFDVDPYSRSLRVLIADLGWPTFKTVPSVSIWTKRLSDKAAQIAWLTDLLRSGAYDVALYGLAQSCTSRGPELGVAFRREPLPCRRTTIGQRAIKGYAAPGDVRRRHVPAPGGPFTLGFVQRIGRLRRHVADVTECIERFRSAELRRLARLERLVLKALRSVLARVSDFGAGEPAFPSRAEISFRIPLSGALTVAAPPAAL